MSIVYSSSTEAKAAGSAVRHHRYDVVCCRRAFDLTRGEDARTTAAAKAERRHAVPLAVSASTATQSRALSALHPLDRPRRGHLQAGRHQVRLTALGTVQETTFDELRNDGTSSEVRRSTQLA